MIKLGMIGTGIIAEAHLNALDENPEFKLVSISEINEEKAKTYSEKYNVPFYLDYKEMCTKEDIDAVIINLPHFLHCESTVFCLERGIHVLCEKPMANTVEECDKMISASIKGNAKLAIGHIQRFVPGTQIIKKYVEEETLGKLVMINEIRNEFYFSETRPAWFFDKKLAGGGIVMNHGAHSFDKISYITGCDLTDFHASCSNPYNDFNIEGHAQIYFKAGDIPCSVSLCGYETYYSNETVYTFTHGALKLSERNGLEICDEKWGSFRKLDYEPFQHSSFGYQLKEFENLILGKESISPQGEYSKNIIAAIQKVYNN